MMKNSLVITILLLSFCATSAAQETTDREIALYEIAVGAPNRIVTPYQNPVFISNTEHEAWSVGRVLYLLPMTEDQTIGGFIQSEDGLYATSVLFQVARIPPQEIRIEDPEYLPVEPITEGGAPPPGETSVHVDSVVETLVEALNNDRIPGFRESTANVGMVVYAGPMRMTLAKAQTRGTRVVETFHLRHDGPDPRNLAEASFHRPGRLGVMVYPPRTEIRPGEELTVYILREAANER
jgi:hypothetical protein